MARSQLSRRPSPRWALRRAALLWPLVLACWVVSVISFLPAVWVVNGAVAPALENLPDGPSEVATGEVQLIARTALRAVAGPLRLAIASGVGTLWLWTVLWHAGLVNWTLWTGGRRLRLGELLGLGVVSWWRYARLSMLSGMVVIAGAVALSLPWTMVEESWVWTLEQRLVPLIVSGVAFAFLLWLVWAATLRAAWLVGMPERRSVALAWLFGLAGTLRVPFASLGTVALWALPAVAISVLPVIVGAQYPALRLGWAVPVLGQLAAAVRAFCWVGLFASFAPVTGLVENGSESESSPV